MPAPAQYDAVIVGGGPAGISAALVLGRARRKVVLFDAGNPRNAASRRVGGFFTRDGAVPTELLRIGRDQLAPYGVEMRSEEVTSAARAGDGGFLVETASGGAAWGRTILLATGVVDRIPDIAGFREYWGRGVHHCPYCDGWESREKPIGIFAHARAGLALSLKMKLWSADVTLYSDGPSRIGADQRARLDAAGVRIRQERIQRLEGTGGHLDRVVLGNGECLPCAAMFVATGNAQRSRLPETLGCAFTRKGAVRTSRTGQRSTVEGVFIAGDAAEDAQFVVIAAAEGAKAAMAMNQLLLERDGLGD